MVLQRGCLHDISNFTIPCINITEIKISVKWTGREIRSDDEFIMIGLTALRFLTQALPHQ